MEKQALFNRFFEVSESVRLDAKPRHQDNTHRHRAHAGQGDAAAPARPPRDPLKMPPSARGVLRLLLQEGQLNQRSIALAMHITAPAVSDAVKKLEERGLITRAHGEINNEYILTLTAQGQDIATRLEEKVRLHAEKLFEGFTEEELRSLHVLVEKMYQNAEN
ncbi:MAG: MarR family transcriptional regulator [Faecalibacterium sp.]